MSELKRTELEMKLRAEMLKNNLVTLDELAAVSGVSRTTLGNVLAEKYAPAPKTIQAIYDALPKSSVQDLFNIFFTH